MHGDIAQAAKWLSMGLVTSVAITAVGAYAVASKVYSPDCVAHVPQQACTYYTPDGSTMVPAALRPPMTNAPGMPSGY